jgi:hypothetical protein
MHALRSWVVDEARQDIVYADIVGGIFVGIELGESGKAFAEDP